MKRLILLHTIDDFIKHKKLENEYNDNTSTKIYAFTIEIRLFLKAKKVKYYLLEDYVSEEEAVIMDELAFHISKNWHNDLFTIKGISLGLLIEKIMFYFFSKTIRNLHVFINLIDKAKPDKIIAFDNIDPHIREINEILEYICSIKNVTLNLIPVDFSTRLNISETSISEIKGQYSINTIIGSSKYFNHLMKTVLKLFWAIPEIKVKLFRRKGRKNILMYGYSYHNSVVNALRRYKNFNLYLFDDRPNILKNRENFQINPERKGTYRKFYEFYRSSKTDKHTDVIYTKLMKRWEKFTELPSFKEIFVYINISFWPIIQKKIPKSVFPNFKRLINFILTSYRILSKNKFDLLIFEADSRERERCLSIIASKLNIPTIVIQHGATVHPTSFAPSFCNKVLAWGKTSKEDFERYGLPTDKIVITGSSRYDQYIHLNQNSTSKEKIKNSTFENFGINTNKKLFVLATIHNHFYKIASTLDFNHLEIEKMYYMTMNAIKKIPDSYLIIKLHPGDMRDDIPLKIKESLGIDNVSITKNYSIVDLIVSCDCFITGYSTSAVEAMILEKPIILINFRRCMEVIPYNKYNIFKTATNSEELFNLINESLNNPIPIENYKLFLKDYIHKLDGRSTKRVVKLIEDLI